MEHFNKNWLVGLVVSVAFGLGAWGLATASDTAKQVAVLESRHTAIEQRLERIEQKLDKLLERGTPGQK